MVGAEECVCGGYKKGYGGAGGRREREEGRSQAAWGTTMRLQMPGEVMGFVHWAAMPVV